ncbi:MAG TPA: hypothetical protein RMH99_16760 [Sandaracinaceae bacterium LLY-WYZ-13_1]|nr:hypothetical protein [Sandaracinaceae bacterium LLY-WYZ-13_1]
MRAVAAALLLALAPIQCGSPPRERPELEDSPAEALWDLSVRFDEAGDAAGRRRTLEYLVERYPSSRFAERARVVLGRQSGAAGSSASAAPPASGPAR